MTPDNRTLSFVTIVYSADYPMLQLQALSLAQFVDPADVSSISLVLNVRDETSLKAQIEPIIASYGPHANKVKIVLGDDIFQPFATPRQKSWFERIYVENRFRLPFFRRGGWRGNNGYRMQQALKLASARSAASEQMVILDTKNIFLRPVHPSDFFAEDGRAKIRFVPVTDGFHRNWFEASLSVLGVPVESRNISKTTTFSTPYPVQRSLILDLLTHIETQYGSVQGLFASRLRPSEFMLINAFCILHFNAVEARFQPCEAQHVGIWPDYDADQIQSLIECIETDDPLVLGLHNRTVGILSPDHRIRLLAALASRGIAGPEEVEDIMRQVADLSK